MRLHPIASDVPCPFCGKPGLDFTRVRTSGDLYTCADCRHTTLHQRAKGRADSACGLRAVLGAMNLGPWRPCGVVTQQVQDAKLAPKGE